jgi:hypothetical protein
MSTESYSPTTPQRPPEERLDDPVVLPLGKGKPTMPERPPEERLERGEVLFYRAAPFAVPRGDDLEFLLHLRQGKLHKNISYNPATGRVGGYARRGGDPAGRLRAVFAAFSKAVTAWLTASFPRYAGGLELDRASYRPLEEATRRLRPTARNDLLHVDAFPNRPAQGRRILRVFANINPKEPRVWVTAEPFAKMLARYGREVGLPGQGPDWLRAVGARLRAALRPGRPRRSAYDSFMLRLHDFLKGNEEFQERVSKHLWSFPPGSAWLAMTDACSHAALRGRYALEHSYFVDPKVLALPGESPAALLEAAARERARAGRAA